MTLQELRNRIEDIGIALGDLSQAELDDPTSSETPQLIYHFSLNDFLRFIDAGFIGSMNPDDRIVFVEDYNPQPSFKEWRIVEVIKDPPNMAQLRLYSEETQTAIVISKTFPKKHN